MKIGIIGANGKAGQLIMAESLKRGHEVIPMTRRSLADFAGRQITKDVLALTKDDVAGLDVVVSALGAFTPETFPLHEASIRHLAAILSHTATRLLIVGGAGSLYMDASHQLQLKDTESFPADYFPLADAMGRGLDLLRTYSQVNWTYFSPAADFDEAGIATGHYQLGGEEFIVNAAGESYISYQDYALAMVDEIEAARHVRQRFTAVQA